MDKKWDPNWTPMEIVGFVRDRLVKQGKRSMSKEEHGMCAYNGVDGHHCAVGWVMPDRPDREIEMLEGESVSSMCNAEYSDDFKPDSEWDQWFKWLKSHENLFSVMQEIHDGDWSLNHSAPETERFMHDFDKLEAFVDSKANNSAIIEETIHQEFRL